MSWDNMKLLIAVMLKKKSGDQQSDKDSSSGDHEK